MQTLWAPWRMEYILSEKEKECIFCLALSDAGNLALYEGSLSMVMMNKYPYINGHLLVAPKRHVAGLHDLTLEEMADLLRTVKDAIKILKKVMKPDGFNVGLNLGVVAGAGVEQHLHFHVVPRWHGDTNAMTVFAEVRVIPEHLEATYRNLKPHFQALEGAG
ncbi:MAG: HIT family hydrolase [Nitrospira bacterium SG8_3]|jgi:ATP adenylyltransferase|nr:MAG: HIT family hydrolase [Nitrospira bacterium SG8_3]